MLENNDYDHLAVLSLDVLLDIRDLLQELSAKKEI